MTLAIFTLVEHKYVNGQFYGYAPYISEMNVWTNHFDKVIVVGNFTKSQSLEPIDLAYTHNTLELVRLPKFNIKTPFSILKFLIHFPAIILNIAQTMRRSDYLHFRCPSNVSAIAAIIQVFFPSKPKSVKYAGNWNPKDLQPIGYRFQKWLFANRTLSKNIKVLVYGQYPNQSKSVVPFISATYTDEERIPFIKRVFSGPLKFVFIGAMVTGKRPLLTIEIIKGLRDRGHDAQLHMFGDGDLMKPAKQLIKDHSLESFVFIYGNQAKAQVKECLLDAHFTILPSKSEGWPKAIAEGMFFGAIPISTEISCLPWILDYGNRGILVEAKADFAVEKIDKELQRGSAHLNKMSEKALKWSQQYTVNRLKQEIGKVVQDGFE